MQCGNRSVVITAAGMHARMRRHPVVIRGKATEVEHHLQSGHIDEKPRGSRDVGHGEPVVIGADGPLLGAASPGWARR